jgi:hypothetical protein
MKKILMSAVTLTAIMGSANIASADDGISILDDVKVNGQIRPRYEYADKDNGVDAGQALTSRVKLNVSSNLFGLDDLKANIGLIGVYDFGWTSDNGLYTGTTNNDKILDPSEAMISNLEATYAINKTTLHAGRGQVNLDNQRFIGTVGWRQLERSYDTLYVADNSVKDLNLLAAWVYGYEGVGGTATTDSNSIILHGSYSFADALKITLYDYMIANRIYGSDTYGVAATGKFDAGAKFNYRAEFAMQGDATMQIGNYEGKADASYMNFDFGANISGFLVGANYELFSGKSSADETGFKSPLGTNHKFNGWADVFMGGNGDAGLQDMNLRLGYKTKGFGKLLAVYHKFDADVGANDDLGSEFDALYANKIPGVKGLNGLLKAAFYAQGDSTNPVDKTVVWAQLDYKF